MPKEKFNVKAVWQESRGEVKKLREIVNDDLKNGTLTGKQTGLIVGMAVDIEKKIIGILEELDVEIEQQGINSPDPGAREKFKALLGALHSLAVSGPGLVEGVGAERLNAVWNCAIQAVTFFLERRAGAVGVDSWNIGASFGFPSGVSGMVSANFRPEKE